MTMPRKPRRPDDVHDIWNVEIGKPYRGQLVEKIDIETTKLDNDRVKIRRLIHLDNEIILLEDTWHDYEEVFQDGKLLPYNEINFPSMDPADFAAPLKKEDEDDKKEKQTKRELLRRKAKDMLNSKNRDQPSSDTEPEDERLKISVETPDGRNLSVLAKLTDTVDDLKEIIADDHDIPVDEHNLIWNGVPLNIPNATMDDYGIKSGDVILMDPKDKVSNGNTHGRHSEDPTNTKSKPKGKERLRKLNSDSAWVYPTKESAPCDGEENNLQGVWSTPPGKESGKDPVEVNVYPIHKEPKSERDTVHGAYGYVNGAKPDSNGVVDPVNVAFYPPGEKNFLPNFKQVGWWSSPESSSITQVKWRFEGDDMIYHKTHTVKVCGHEMTFVSEWIE